MKFFNKMSAKFLFVALLGVGMYGQLSYAAAGEGELAIQQTNDEAMQLLRVASERTSVDTTSWLKNMTGQLGDAAAKVRDFVTNQVKNVVEAGRNAVNKMREVFDASVAKLKKESKRMQDKLIKKATEMEERYNALKDQIEAKVAQGIESAQKQWEVTKTALEEAKKQAEEALAPYQEKAVKFGTMVVSVGTSVDAINKAAEQASTAKESLDQQLKILKRTEKLSPEDKQAALKTIVEDSSKIGDFVALLDDKFIAHLSALFSDSDKEAELKKEGKPGTLENIRAGLASYLNTLEVIKYLVGDEELLALKKTEPTVKSEWVAGMDKEQAAKEEQEKREKEEAAAIKIQRAFRASRPEQAPEKPAGRPEETAQERLAREPVTVEEITPAEVIIKAGVDLPKLQEMLTQAVVK